MTRKFVVLMLLAGISRASFAQTNSDRLFDLPADFGLKSFYVELGKGNIMQVDLTNPEDLSRMTDIDGILAGFLLSLEPLKDSLSDELSSVRIDYILDSSAYRKLRIQKFPPKGSAFTLDHKEVSALKLEQDTVNFIGIVHFTAKYGFRKPFNDERKFRIRFLVNDVHDLKSYIGLLNSKIAAVRARTGKSWTMVDRNTYAIKTDPYIRSHMPGGMVHGQDFAYLRFAVSLQNYKNYFAPAFGLGAGLILSNNGFFKRDFLLSWEPHFIFGPAAQGSTRAYRNDFLTLTFGQGPVRDKDPHKSSEFLTVISIGYLVHREGEFVDKRTFRFGGGALSLFEGKTKIEPSFYFTDFFRHLTPGIRLIQSF